MPVTDKQAVRAEFDNIQAGFDAVWSTVSGSEPAPLGVFPRYMRLALFHRGRLWRLNCSPKTDTAGQPIPEISRQFRPFELSGLALHVLWWDVLASLRQATSDLCAKWYR